MAVGDEFTRTAKGVTICPPARVAVWLDNEGRESPPDAVGVLLGIGIQEGLGPTLRVATNGCTLALELERVVDLCEVPADMATSFGFQPA